MKSASIFAAAAFGLASVLAPAMADDAHEVQHHCEELVKGHQGDLHNCACLAEKASHDHEFHDAFMAIHTAADLDHAPKSVHDAVEACEHH